MVRTYAFTAKGLGQSLVGELRPSKPCGSAKKNKTNKKKKHTHTNKKPKNKFISFYSVFCRKISIIPIGQHGLGLKSEWMLSKDRKYI